MEAAAIIIPVALLVGFGAALLFGEIKITKKLKRSNRQARINNITVNDPEEL